MKTIKNEAGTKLLLIRIVAIALLAFLLVKLDIVNNTMSDRDTWVSYTIAAILALPIVIVLDKYLVKLAK